MKKITYLLTILTILFSLASCNTTKEVPQNLTYAQMLQLGQNAYSTQDYTYAEQIYLSILEKFGDDALVYVETRYELGHLYMATKDYKKAEINFNEIIGIYNKLPAGSLPPAQKKLAENGLEKIKEIMNSKETKE